MKRSFTLIELLIVLVIIGILATLAIPAYQSYIDKAKLAEMKTITKSLVDAVWAYYQETGTWPGNPDIPDDSDEIPADLGVTVPTSKYFHYNVHTHASPTSPGGHVKAYYKGPGSAHGWVVFEIVIQSDGRRIYSWGTDATWVAQGMAEWTF